MPALARDVTISRESLWWLHEGNRAIRVGDWKLVAAKGAPWELYDLAADRSGRLDRGVEDHAQERVDVVRRRQPLAEHRDGHPGRRLLRRHGRQLGLDDDRLEGGLPDHPE